MRFNFNDLYQKHKLCLECIDTHKEEAKSCKRTTETFKVCFKKLCFFLTFKNISNFKTKIENLENEKLQINNLLNSKIEEIEKANKKLLTENDENIKIIKDLKRKCNQLEIDVDKSNKINLELVDTNHALEKVNLKNLEKIF